MPATRRSPFAYAIVRVVPHVERGEAINAGVIVGCRPRRFLAARVTLDTARLLALAPDCDEVEIRRHLDAIPRYSAFRPKVIVRTAIATDVPLDPGPQHVGDHSHAIEAMLQTVKVVRLELTRDIMPAYREAMAREGSTLLVEYSRLY